MKKRNIHQNQELLHIFEAAGSNEKVMCVPMDFSKKDHLVIFCSGNGDILRKPFAVKNTPAGIACPFEFATGISKGYGNAGFLRQRCG